MSVREKLVRGLQYIKWHLLLDFHLAMPSDPANKCQLNQLLCSFSHGHNINMVGRENSLVHRNEAGITLESYMMKFSEKGEAHALMEKWDRSVLLTPCCLSHVERARTQSRSSPNDFVEDCCSISVTDQKQLKTSPTLDGKLQKVRKWWNLLPKLIGVISLRYCGEPQQTSGSVFGLVDRQGYHLESCVWRAASFHSSHHSQEVSLAQFSLYVHKGGLKPHSFHFSFRWLLQFTD